MICNQTEIRTIKNLEELETVRACWQTWQSHPNSDYSLFQLVCRLRREVMHPFVTIVECDGRPRAILAGRMELLSFVPTVGYLKVVRIPSRVLTFVYQGLLGQVDEKVGGALIQHLYSMLALGEADIVAFHHLREDSPLQRALRDYGPRYLRKKRPVWSNHWEMAIPKEVGFLQHKVRSKHRSWIRRKQRELESSFPGKVSWRWISRFDDVPGLCAELEHVAARTYQRGLGAGFINDEEHRQQFGLFSEQGLLRVQTLEIEGKVRAFWIGTVCKGIFYSSATGYDPDLRKFEPGTLIFINMLDELVREGIAKFDFGLGDASYKQRFGDRCWQETTIRLFAPTFKGLVLRTTLGFFAALDNAGRRLVQRTEMLGWLKRRWRRRLTQLRPETEEK